jgi:hypothetical protein
MNTIPYNPITNMNSRNRLVQRRSNVVTPNANTPLINNNYNTHYRYIQQSNNQTQQYTNPVNNIPQQSTTTYRGGSCCGRK